MGEGGGEKCARGRNRGRLEETMLKPLQVECKPGAASNEGKGHTGQKRKWAAGAEDLEHKRPNLSNNYL